MRVVFVHPTLIPLLMNLRFAYAALAAFTLLFSACTKSEKDKPAAGKASGLDTVEQKVSYGIGYNMGTNLARQAEVKFDRAAIQAGIDDGLAGAKTRIAEADIQAAFTSMDQKISAANAAAGEKNLAAAKAFLDKNRTRKGVTTTPSGLQYEVLTKGKGGKKPKATDSVEVHYHGTLADGTVFDSSVERKEPVTLALNGVIPGWTEALQLMSVGDKWKLTIPPALGYGPKSAGKIPPNSVLIFEVELRSIK